MPRLALPLLLLLALTCLNGCAAYGVYDDPRLAGTMSADTELAAKIKTALMDESFTGGWSVAVYSFYNHVFLVGEVPADMQAKALTIARRYKPHSVTPHWFTAKTHDESDMALATKLRTELIGTKGLSSTRVETEVNAGRVVLLEKDRQSAASILAVIAKLQAQDTVQCLAVDAFVWAQQVNETFDVVFIDPPFALSLHQKAVQAALPHLKKDGFLYLENESEIPDEMLSKWGLQAVRRGRAGAVYYLLCVRSIG